MIKHHIIIFHYNDGMVLSFLPGISDCKECNMPLECAVDGISRSTST